MARVQVWLSTAAGHAGSYANLRTWIARIEALPGFMPMKRATLRHQRP